MDRPVRRGRHRRDVEDEIARRREKQEQHQLLWDGACEYYDKWRRRNAKYEDWTSPRYYEENGRLIREREAKREREERLVSRRDRLRKLLREEEQSYKIEVMVRKHKKPSTTEEVPVEVLREINNEVKSREEDRRRYEAEMKLYHSWRTNNPIVRQYESKFRHKDLKLSWLDQQVEKRMRQEKEEEENKRLLKEQEERVRKQAEEQKAFERYLQEKRTQLKSYLDRQVEELNKRKEEERELERSRLEECSKRAQLDELEEERRAEEKRRLDREYALYNIRQYKMKLKAKACHIEEDLRRDEAMVAKFRRLQLEEMLEDELKREQIKTELSNLLELIDRQKQLEKQRQKHLEFLFDSEAKTVYEQHSERWRREESARRRLLADVTAALRAQIDEKIRRNESKLEDCRRQHDELERRAEEYRRELEALRSEEERRKAETRAGLDEQVEVKEARKRLDESRKLREINEELDRIRKEEEKLQEEIARIQLGARRPTSHRKTTRLF